MLLSAREADAPPGAYRELGGVAGDDALDIGIHPISQTHQDNSCRHILSPPCQQTLAPPPSPILPKRHSRVLITTVHTCPDSLTKKFSISHASLTNMTHKLWTFDKHVPIWEKLVTKYALT